MRIITEEKNEHKIIEAAQRQINEDEAQLIEKHRAGRGEENEWVILDDTIDTITARENLKSEAKAIIDAHRAEQEAHGGLAEDSSWEQVMNMLYDRIRDSITINQDTGESFWPTLSVPEALNTRRGNQKDCRWYRGRQFGN